MKPIKLLFFSLFCMCLACLASCTEPVQPIELVVPTNVTLNGTILSFDGGENIPFYRLELVGADGIIIRRYAESGVDLNTLNIPEGTYTIKVQSANQAKNDFSLLSEGVTYMQKDLDAVKEIEADALIDGNYIKWMGRTSYDSVNKVNTMYYSASAFEVKVKMTEESISLSATLTATNPTNTSKQPYVVLVKDNDFENTITVCLKQATTELTIVGDGGFEISDKEVHTIAVYKRSESIDSHVGLKKLTTTGKFISGVEYKDRKIEVIAASSSTGYGNLSSAEKTTATSDALHAFAFLTAQNLNSEINIVSASGWGISASRWTSPMTLNMRDKYKYVDVFSTELWDTSKYTPDVIVTNFGTNDLSYINAVTDKTEQAKRRAFFIENYVGFLNDLHATYPKAKIIVIYGLMLESGVYEDTVKIYEQAKVTIPDLEILQLVGDAKGYNSHPSVASHKIIAENLTNKIKEMMEW